MTISLSQEALSAIAQRVDEAQMNGQSLTLPTAEHEGFDIACGYLVQDLLRERWRARGRRLVGYKAGLTSRAKMAQMKVDTPTFGFITADMAVPDGGACPTKLLSRPRVEPEIAFLLKHDIPARLRTEADVLAATEFIVPAIEIIDSRYADYKFDLPSVVADNSSSARYVIGGRPRRPNEIDLRTIGIVVLQNGEIVGEAASGAVLGSPARTIVMLSRWLAERGETLASGSLILTGGACEARLVSNGDTICARFQDMGDVTVRFVEED
ncbi:MULTISPECIES: 2-keto-4-pentenoate hydratase [Sphingomonadaceae]|uniref:2-keto-4-pentenoate hydratase n=1 Tax=Sphingomonadales TaxID=204457 RepID=UPI0005CC50D8|nr:MULTISPECIES: fumarylacetoacetate hydrolase family protein [Sphingomonadaceae]AJR26782.1 4-oxalocrotonate decarboxylase [Sphingobium sp. YBL2]KKC24313.1 4-oxalocrotonate decarboxylase [Sphingomonas sp. SRS2]